MPRVGNDLTYRFRALQSRTPLYQAESLRFYWNHCWYCGIELVYDKHAKKLRSNSFTRDHVVPNSAGGGKGINTVPACNKCNKIKMNLSLDQFRVKLLKNSNGLFFGEQKEKDISASIASTRIRLPLATQLASIIGPAKPNIRPIPVRCMVRRELFVRTPITCLLSRLFRLW